MAAKQLASKDIDGLLAWYKKAKRDFPWRADPSPYLVWLAEIMSQQTQLATLVPFYHRFLARFPDVRVLAKAGEPDVLAAWAGLGYYSRARNVHRAAKMIVDELGGKFPETLEGLLELPGVGPYTAAAIASQCFGVREPVWDGNVQRVCSRLFAREDAHAPAFRAESEAVLRALMQRRDASAFNQSFMELGALVCAPKSPSCDVCPLERACGARRADAVEKFPPPKPRKQVVELRCRVRVRLRGAKELLDCQAYLEPRTDGRWFAGLWDFPSELGGASKPLLRFEKGEGKSFGEVRHQITHHRIFLRGELEREPAGKNAAKKENGWYSVHALTSENPPIPLSTTAKKMLRLLLRKNSEQLALL